MAWPDWPWPSYFTTDLYRYDCIGVQSRTAWRELVKISNVDDKMSSVDDDYDDGMGPERLRTAVDWRDRI